jgi:hypothetical protein
MMHVGRGFFGRRGRGHVVGMTELLQGGQEREKESRVRLRFHLSLAISRGYFAQAT